MSADVRISTPSRFRLTAPVPAEDDLAASLASALRPGVLLRDGEVFNAWDLSNARSAMEGARKKRIGCLPGWPDCSVWWEGGVALLELKRQRGWQLSPAQRELHARLAAIGHPVAVCHTVDEALDVLRARGVRVHGRVAA